MLLKLSNSLFLVFFFLCVVATKAFHKEMPLTLFVQEVCGISNLSKQNWRDKDYEAVTDQLRGK